MITGNKDYIDLFSPLKKWGYNVIIAHDISECKELLRTAEFSLAFIDIENNVTLPLFLQAFQELRFSLSLIGLASLSKDKLKHFLNARNISFDDFAFILYRPLDLDELIFAIEEVIEKNNEKSAEDEKPLNRQDREKQLLNRRRPLENKRLARFLETSLKHDFFED